MNVLNHNPTKPPPLTKLNSLIPPKTAQIVLPNKMKLILGKRIVFRCSIPSSLTSVTKYRPKMLSTVELIGLQSNKPNFNNVRTICQALKDAKKVSSLVIEKDDPHSQNLRQLKHIFNNTHHHLKKLVVSFVHSDEEEHHSYQEAAEIATRFRRYRDLLILDLHLSCKEHLKNHILFHLLQQLKGLLQLHTLSLDLKGCENRDRWPEGYEPNALIFTFKFPRSLRYLSMNLQESRLLNQKLLSACVSNISRCKALFHLGLRCGCNYQPSDIKLFVLLFEREKSLKSFKINKFFDPFLQYPDCFDFLKIFQSLKHLVELDIFLFFVPEDTATVFTKHFFKYLASLINLKSLKLNLFVRKFTSEDADSDDQNLFLPLQHLINLRFLHLRLQCDQDRKLPSLQSLSQAFQSLHDLKDFELFFTKHKATRSHFTSLSHMFKAHSSLQSLVLVFYDADLEPDSLELLSKGISHLKLSLFTLDVGKNNKDFSRQQKNKIVWKHQKQLTPFFSTLGKFTSLNSLSLNLSVFEILTKELTSLSLELGKIKQLRSLYLELHPSPPAQNFKGLRNLMATIKEMSNLTFLQLIFQGDKLCEEEVELVASSLAECSTSLKGLVLYFYEAKGLKDRSLLALNHALRFLSSLEHLKLLFGPQAILNRETVYGLFETLSLLKNLETIIIYLPSDVFFLDFEVLLRKFATHWNLKSFIVNGKSGLKSVDRNENEH